MRAFFIHESNKYRTFLYSKKGKAVLHYFSLTIIIFFLFRDAPKSCHTLHDIQTKYFSRTGTQTHIQRADLSQIFCCSCSHMKSKIVINHLWAAVSSAEQSTQNLVCSMRTGRKIKSCQPIRLYILHKSETGLLENEMIVLFCSDNRKISATTYK